MKKTILTFMLCIIPLCTITTCASEQSMQQTLLSWIYSFIIPDTFEQDLIHLLEQADHATITNPTHLQNSCPNFYFDYQGTLYHIDQISNPITQGNTYQVMQHILTTIPQANNYPLQLRYCHQEIIQPISTSCYIILPSQYYNFPDAIKLFVLYHELQHHLYDDVSNNHLQKILNLQSDNSTIFAQFNQHKDSLVHHIKKYAEYRADKGAMQAISCPYCLQEIAQYYEQCFGKVQPGTYHPCGYFYAWQFQSHIQSLIDQKQCCIHHQENGKIVDLSCTDESTMLKRLHIDKNI